MFMVMSFLLSLLLRKLYVKILFNFFEDIFGVFVWFLFIYIFFVVIKEVYIVLQLVDSLNEERKLV